MVKYHIGKNGPGKCNATERSCPVGGEHFKSLGEAEKAYGKKMNGGDTSMRKAIKIDVRNDPRVNAEMERAKSYRKNVIVSARVASKGEKLQTILKNGTVETSRVLEGGEFIVKNPGGEEYAMGAGKFLSRYERHGDKWRSTGVIRAIKNPFSRPITIDASWGEEQHGDANCYIGEALDGERYILGDDEFRETYIPEDDEFGGGSISAHVSKMAGGRYYGAHVPGGAVQQGLDKVRSLVGDEKFEIMREFKAARDRGEVYHLTVITPPEMKGLKSVPAPPENITINFKGVGRAVDGDNEAFFMVCDSPEIKEWRRSVGLPPKDLHVTLAFMNRDVHSKSKGIDSLIS